MIGDKYNLLTVIADTGRKIGGNKVYRFLCDCGNFTDVRLSYVKSGHTKSCGCLKLRRHENLVGRTFNRLTVLELSTKRTKHRSRYYKCLCTCGNSTEVISSSIKSGHTKSCGCLDKEVQKIIHSPCIGERFGRLIIMRDTGKRNRGNIIYLCKCDCGKEKEINIQSIRAGKTSSCGCFHKEAPITHGLSKTKEYRNFISNLHYIKKKKRMPKWADLEKIKKIYANCPIGQEVDHIYPLHGKLVSGLHVHNNLQYLTRPENCSKRNKFIPISIKEGVETPILE